MKKKNTLFISVLAVIFIFLVALSVFVNYYISNQENKISIEENSENNEISEKGCRASEGYTWNETDEACVRESEKSSRYYINNDPEFCKRIQFLCVEEKVPFYNKNGCGCELKSTTQN